MKAMETDKKIDLNYKQWEAPQAKAALLLVHGFGGHISRWGFLSNFFLKNGLCSYALDLKGFGETGWPQGSPDYFNIYFAQILQLYNIIKKENPAQKVFIIGESMGGLISFLLTAKKAEFFTGLICISPAFRDILKFSPFDYIKIFSSVFFNPNRKFEIHFDSWMCTRDIEYQRIMDSDKKEIREAKPKLLFDIVMGELRALFLKNKIRIPVLFLLAGQDKIVDSEMSKKVFNALKVKDKALIEYTDNYHALSIDLGREKVFEDILNWIQKRLEG